MFKNIKLFENYIQNTSNNIFFTLKTINREDIIKYPDDINKAYGSNFSFGGYLERRGFYNSGKKIIHAGIDLFINKGEKLYMPFDGIISDIFVDNPPNYKVGSGTGAQVIVYHTQKQIADVIGKNKAKNIFKSFKYLKIIYIHLDYGKTYKKNLINKEVQKGEIIGFVGSRYNNGGWAPHVHVEAFLVDEMSKVITKEDKINKGAIGVLNTDEIITIKKRNLIDPDLLFGFTNSEYKKMNMDLNSIVDRETIIKIRDLSISYKKEQVLNKINLDIKKGELITFLGHSGSGKTSLLNAISGFIKYNGVIDIGDEYDKTDIGYVFQDNIMYPSQNVYNNIYLGGVNNKRYKISLMFDFWLSKAKNEDLDEVNNVISIYKGKNNDEIASVIFKERFKKIKKIMDKNYEKFKFKEMLKIEIKNICAKLGITNLLKKKINTLSGGQKQRVAIAKAMIKKPVFLIMDEPLSSLDASTRNESRTWIKNFQVLFGITLIFVTHDQNEAMLISDRIVCIHNKKIEQIGTPDEIYNNPSTPFIASFIGFPKINKINSKYIRPYDIEISRNGHHEIMKIEQIDRNKIYHVDYNGMLIRVLSSELYIVGDKIKVSWLKKNELTFESESND